MKEYLINFTDYQLLPSRFIFAGITKFWFTIYIKRKKKIQSFTTVIVGLRIQHIIKIYFEIRSI